MFAMLIGGDGVSLPLAIAADTETLLHAVMQANRARWVLLAGVPALLATAVFWRPVQRLFHVGRLHPDDLAVCLAAGIFSQMLLEFVKIAVVPRVGKGERMKPRHPHRLRLEQPWSSRTTTPRWVWRAPPPRTKSSVPIASWRASFTPM